MVSLTTVALLERKPDISRSLFTRYWRDVHGVMAARIPGFESYIQYHVTPLNDTGASIVEPFEGVAIVTFADAKDRAGLANSDISQYIQRDEQNVFRRALLYNLEAGANQTLRAGDGRAAEHSAFVLVPAAGSWIPRGFKVVPFTDILSAIEQRQTDTLQGLVADRIVVLVAEPVAGTNRIVTQTNLLDRILSGAWPRRAPFAWTVLGSFLVAGFAAWLWLAVRWWRAAIATATLALGYAAAVSSSASLTGLLLPLAIPLTAVAVSSVSSLLWNQLTSAYRVRHLEGEVAAIREGLVRQESVVEALEEDLEAARVAVARSTGGEEALRVQLAAARAQEEQTRTRLEELERRARAWSAGDVRETPLGDAEQGVDVCGLNSTHDPSLVMAQCATHVNGNG